MQVGDLVTLKGDIHGVVGYTLGIIIDVEDGIATVSWFNHPFFGSFENYCAREELIFFNKNI